MAIDLEAIKKKIEQLKTGRKTSNIQLWKPGVGEYVVRGLPWPTKFLTDGQPFVERWFYYIGNNPGMLAPSQFGKHDPINEFIRKLYASGDQKDRAMAKELKAKMRAYMPVVVLEGPGADPKKVLVWAFGKIVHQRLLSFFLKKGVDDFCDPQNGFNLDVKVSKLESKKFLDTEVDLQFGSTPLAQTNEEVKALLDAIPDINELYKETGAEELERVLNNWLSGESSNEEATRGGEPKVDALEELADDIKAAASPAPSSKKEPEEKKKKAKSDTKSDLDEAFDELMDDE